jgi:hypothetical protein
MNPGYAISVKNKPHTKPCRLVPGVGTTERWRLGPGTAEPGGSDALGFIDEGYSLGVELLKIRKHTHTRAEAELVAADTDRGGSKAWTSQRATYSRPRDGSDRQQRAGLAPFPQRNPARARSGEECEAVSVVDDR